MTAPIVIVDDDANLLAGLRRHFRKEFSITTFTDPAEALKADELKNASVVLADMRMPGMDGIAFLKKVAKIDGTIQRMMLTGDADQATAVEALNSGGVSKFFNKPCTPENLIQGLKMGVRQHQLENAERELLEKTLSGSVRVLVDILSMTQPDAFGMASRLRKLVRAVLPATEIKPTWAVDMAAMLLPLGWVSIPPQVQAKYVAGELLNPQELEMVSNIPASGADLVDRIPRLSPVADIIRHSAVEFDKSREGTPAAAHLLHILVDLDRITKGRAPDANHVMRLKNRGGIYDQTLLRQIEGHLIPDDQAAAVTAREYIVSDLIPGLELLEDLKTEDGKLILASGRELTDVIISRVKNFARMSKVRQPILCRLPQ